MSDIDQESYNNFDAENDYNLRKQRAKFLEQSQIQQRQQQPQPEQPGGEGEPSFSSPSSSFKPSRSLIDAAYGHMSDKQREDIQTLTTDPSARALAEANYQRRCPYCHEQVFGEDNEAANVNVMQEHYRSCKSYRFKHQQREQFYEAAASIDSTVSEITTLIHSRRDLDRELTNKIDAIADIAERFGNGQPLCRSLAEYNLRYDHGKRDTVTVWSTGQLSSAGGHAKRMLKVFPDDRKKDEITRLCDDALLDLRTSYPYSEVGALIDQRLLSRAAAATGQKKRVAIKTK